MTMPYDDEQLKAKIQRAINITKDLDEPYRSKAFEIVLSSSINHQLITEKETEQKKTENAPTTESGLDAKIQNFANKCNLKVEQLKNVYEFEEDTPIFIVRFKKTETEKQILISRLLLVAYEEVYDQEWLSLKQILKNHGVKGLKHLSENIEKSGLFLKKGGTKSTQYKLVSSIKFETCKMVAQLAKGENLIVEPKDKKEA